MNEQWLDLFRNEIQEFTQKTRAFAAGEMSRKDYKGASGGFGTYAQRDGTKHMLRLRMPGGRLTGPRLQFLARIASLSASQLTRVFRNTYGQSPYDYVLARKIDTACRLLLNTGMSVKEVAYRLNFVDEHYFSNVFCKRMGMPPGRYRTEGRSR